VLKQDLEDKNNQKSFAYSVSVANDEYDDSDVSAYLLSASSGFGFYMLISCVQMGNGLRHLNPIMLVLMLGIKLLE
jgi:hypothetical protein